MENLESSTLEITCFDYDTVGNYYLTVVRAAGGLSHSYSCVLVQLSRMLTFVAFNSWETGKDDYMGQCSLPLAFLEPEVDSLLWLLTLGFLFYFAYFVDAAWLC